jgi:hypothetical protein
LKPNKNQANKTVFLDFCCFKIEESKTNIIAKAQGFILSHKAAGTNIKKNFILPAKVMVVVPTSPDAKATELNKNIQNSTSKTFTIMFFLFKDFK